jgi:uncharacterized protein YkwD
MRRPALAAVCLALLAAVAAPAVQADPAPCADADLNPAPDNLDRVGAAVDCLINAERIDRGRGSLATSSQLGTAAQRMSDQMVQQQFFSHITPDGRNVADRVRPTGYLPRNDTWVLGENLAWGSFSLGTPRAIVQGWMDSSEHRQNILATDYEDIGIGVTLGSPTPDQSGGTTYSIDFGSRNARLSVAVPRRFVAQLEPHGPQRISYLVDCSTPCTLVARLSKARGRLRLKEGGNGMLTVRLSEDTAKSLLADRRRTFQLVTKAVGTRIARTTRVTLAK